MSLFICAKCGCVENTATSDYWAVAHNLFPIEYGGSGFLLGNADEIIKRLDIAINTDTPLTMRELKQLKLVLMK